MGLAYDEAERLRVLAPVREHVRLRHSPEASDLARTAGYYLEQANTLGNQVGGEGGADAAHHLSADLANHEALIRLGLEGTTVEAAIEAARGLGQFSQVTGLGPVVTELLVLASRAANGLGDVLGEANCIWRLGHIALARSEHEQARRRYEEALPLYKQVGHVLGEANCILSLGHIALARSEHEQARRRYEEALPLYKQVGHVLGEANCILSLGDIALDRSEPEQARRRYKEALLLYKQVGDVLGEANCIWGLGNIALDRLEPEQARRRRYEEALPLYKQVGSVPGEANYIQCLGDIALDRSEPEQARRQWLAALMLYERLPEPYSIGWTWVRLARLVSQAEERLTCVQQARDAWTRVGRDDLLKILEDEFGKPPPEAEARGHARSSRPATSCPLARVRQAEDERKKNG